MKCNNKIVRTLTGTVVVLGAAAMLSVGAFAAETADLADPVAAGYLPPQEQMVQGDIALHSADVAIGEKDPTYGGYGAPEGNPIQGNIMLISGDELAAPSADAAAKKSEARYTVKGLFGREVLYTARQKDSVLTLDVPAGCATFRTTVQDMQTLLNEGVSTLVFQTEKGTTTLNLSLLCEGQSDPDTLSLTAGKLIYTPVCQFCDTHEFQCFFHCSKIFRPHAAEGSPVGKTPPGDQIRHLDPLGNNRGLREQPQSFGYFSGRKGRNAFSIQCNHTGLWF